MTQIKITLDDQAVNAALDGLEQGAKNLRPAMQDIGEHLLREHQSRWAQGVAPDGAAWKPLTPSTWANKRGSKMLYEEGDMLRGAVYRPSNDGLVFGLSDWKAPIHHFGAKIKIAARSQQAYFRTGKNGVGNRFVKKKKSNFAQWVTLPAYDIKIPARPLIGVSPADEREIVDIIKEHLTTIVTTK